MGGNPNDEMVLKEYMQYTFMLLVLKGDLQIGQKAGKKKTAAPEWLIWNAYVIYSIWMFRMTHMTFLKMDFKVMQGYQGKLSL